MNRFKGTPAPWHIDNLITVAINSDCKHVAVINLSEKVSKDESSSNANLIAAAPELLEVLIEISEMQKLNYGDGMTTHIKLIEMVRKADLAIQKALGEVK